ncbi:MAG: glycoside hydrolase family 3 C-terminal domain-containing protein [Desulfurococcaceae archaeon]|jgi:beta-glucosidase|nr:glycoside hydrolase family 3 C-terminal domain-containing protein [Desulfurococcaceae archaeon]
MSKVEEILKQMTIEEKISLLVGAGSSTTVPGAAGETRSISRLGIPAIVLADGPAGVRIAPLRFGVQGEFYATHFPNAIMLASTWNLEVVEKVGKAIGEEAKEYGVDILLAPALNIHRTVLGGRNFEYFSEDPLLSGVIVAAYVRGVQSVGVGATLKHFVGNDQEAGRMYVNIVVDERALREIYLRAFEIAIELSKPWAIMAAYNKLNSYYCTQNLWLLTKVLREDWGFEGLVMTDWFAGDNPIEQVKAGVDLIMPGDDGIVKKLIDAYKRGELRIEDIEERDRKVLSIILKSLKYQGYRWSNKPDLDEHARIAYEAALEGIVLLKNDGALPIKSSSRVALFGRGSYYTVRGGLGSGYVHARYTVSIAEGLRERGFKVDEDVEKVYRRYMLPLYELGDCIEMFRRLRDTAVKSDNKGFLTWLLFDISEMLIEYYRTLHLPEDPFDDGFLEEIAKRNDVAIVTISRISGEGWDRKPVEGDFYLRDDEYRLLLRVSETFHKHGKKVIVVLNIPSPIDIVSWRDLVDAILVIWLPGQEGGRALADILLGKVSPSGKLPLTWPRDLEQDAATRMFPYEPRQELVYREGIYVGYRYYDTFGVEPVYEFGYGLSYTKFEFSDMYVEKDVDKIKIKLKIRNVGGYPGKEVVQVYIKPPRGSIDKPYQELKGFKKTKTLKPGEEDEVVIDIPIKYLASYVKGRWVVEKGLYEVRIGASSRDIKVSKSIEIEREYCFNTKWIQIECS